MRKIASTSSYYKIHALLESLKSQKVTSKQEIEDYMAKLNQPIFFSKKYVGPPVDALVPEFSRQALKKVIRLCMVLGLIDDDGITSIGKDALKRNNFDSILSDQIIDVLKSNNIELATLNKVVKGFLKERIPTLPTASEIFKKIEDRTEIKYLFFSKLLTLLAHAGSASTSQTKIYLEFKEE